MVSCSSATPQPRDARFSPDSVDRIRCWRDPPSRAAARRHGRDRVTARGARRRPTSCARACAARTRRRRTSDRRGRRVARAARRSRCSPRGIAPSLTRVINATGVILHTNLGRAPLAAEAHRARRRGRARATRISSTTSTPARAAIGTCTPSACSRRSPAPRPRSSSTTTPRPRCSSLAALAAGREVIVSRGELVEIGGGFRVPDVLAQSGAIAARSRHDESHARQRLRRGHQRPHGAHPARAPVELPDRGLHRAAAVSPNWPPSPTGSHSRSFEDLGSGWLGLEGVAIAGLARRAVGPRRASRAGADLVAFSGDKLLGGPQAGIIVGRRDLIDRVRTHPLMRAVRVDKLTYAALEATLALWAQAPARSRIPGLSDADDDASTRSSARARALVARLVGRRRASPAAIIDGVSTIGGGSAPGSAWPTRLVARQRRRRVRRTRWSAGCARTRPPWSPGFKTIAWCWTCARCTEDERRRCSTGRDPSAERSADQRDGVRRELEQVPRQDAEIEDRRPAPGSTPRSAIGASAGRWPGALSSVMYIMTTMRR